MPPPTREPWRCRRADMRAPGRRSSPAAHAGDAAQMFANGLLSARIRHRPSLSAEILRLTAGCDVGKAPSCHRWSFPGLDRMQGPPLGGLLLFWAIGLQRVDDSLSACRHWWLRHCACSSAAETLAVVGLKLSTVGNLPANQRHPSLIG